MNSLEQINFYLLEADEPRWLADADVALNQVAIGHFVEMPDKGRFFVQGVEHSASGLKVYGVLMSYQEMLAHMRNCR